MHLLIYMYVAWTIVSVVTKDSVKRCLHFSVFFALYCFGSQPSVHSDRHLYYDLRNQDS